MTPLLEVSNLSAAYGPFRTLFDIDLTISEGQAIALLGSNGSGKSTIARVLSGLVPSTAGRVIFGGSDITHWPAAKRRQSGMLHIPEGRGIFSTLSVEENLRLQLLSAPRSKRRVLMDEAYERFEILGERRDAKAGSLSGGQQRLLALAGAIVSPPSLLIADELSLGLAPNVLDEVYAALTSIRDSGVAILVIEQQIDRALGLADAATVIDHGAIAYSGPPSGATKVLEELLGGGDLIN